MPKDSGAPAACPHAALRALADALAPHLVRYLAPKVDDSVSYFSQYDSPLGRKRHLELARTGQLPGYRVGRLVLVRRETVRAYIEGDAMDAPRARLRAHDGRDGVANANGAEPVPKGARIGIETGSKSTVVAVDGPKSARIGIETRPKPTVVRVAGPNAFQVGIKGGTPRSALRVPEGGAGFTQGDDDELADWGLVRRGRQ